MEIVCSAPRSVRTAKLAARNHCRISHKEAAGWVARGWPETHVGWLVCHRWVGQRSLQKTHLHNERAALGDARILLCDR